MDVKLAHDGVPVTILHGPYVANGAPTPEALTFIASLIARLDEIRHYAARKKLLRLHNDSWRDEDSQAIDEDGFVARLASPRVLVFDEIGAATVYFSDGGLFDGHTVEVSVRKGELVHAGILG